MSPGTLIRLGAAFALLGIGAGSFGAHALADALTPEMRAVYETGVRYQMYHALALLLLAALSGRFGPKVGGWAGGCFAAGIVLFSGSLYALALTGERRLGAVAPVGGALFLAGWLVLLLHA